MHFLPHHHKILAGTPALFAELCPVQAGPGKAKQWLPRGVELAAKSQPREESPSCQSLP